MSRQIALVTGKGPVLVVYANLYGSVNPWSVSWCPCPGAHACKLQQRCALRQSSSGLCCQQDADWHDAAAAGVLVMVVLLCLTPVFRNMPQNAQGAIIIAAVIGLFNYSEWLFLWRVGCLLHCAPTPAHKHLLFGAVLCS